MPSKQELEGLPLTGLAVLCKKVADNPEQYTEAGAAVALKLRELWFLLEERFNPSLREQEEGERKQAELKKRMAEFLADMLYVELPSSSQPRYVQSINTPLQLRPRHPANAGRFA